MEHLDRESISYFLSQVEKINTKQSHRRKIKETILHNHESSALYGWLVKLDVFVFKYSN